LLYLLAYANTQEIIFNACVFFGFLPRLLSFSVHLSAALLWQKRVFTPHKGVDDEYKWLLLRFARPRVCDHFLVLGRKGAAHGTYSINGCTNSIHVHCRPLVTLGSKRPQKIRQRKPTKR
jgi:hypothetical protein